MDALRVISFALRIPRTGFRYCHSLFRPRLPARASADYSTHIPVLAAIAKIARVRRVLELGCGYYSTPIFLNRSIFPELSLLHSLEDDPVWLEKVARTTNNDMRLKLELVSEQVNEVLPRLLSSRYDLVFVDNAREISQRANTIRVLSEHLVGEGLVVIHDFEIVEYRLAARHFDHRFEFTAFNPTTGVAWQGRGDFRRALRDIARIIALNATRLAPDAVEDWTTALGSEGDLPVRLKHSELRCES